jgi:hypothetical protein
MSSWRRDPRATAMTNPGPGRLFAVISRGLWVAAAIGAAGCLLASCATRGPAAGSGPANSGGSGRATPAAATSPASGLSWMLTRAALAQMITQPAVRAGLARSRVYQILQLGQRPLAVAGAVPVVTFSAVGGLHQAITGQRLPIGTRAVLYDPEAWSFTPHAEQVAPARAAQSALSLARAHGLRLIVAPALNLSTVRPGLSGPRWRQFLELDLAGQLAKVSDVIELQAQSLERSPRTYRAFVRAAAAQARQANPAVQVLAGLSTNPPGAMVTSRQLIAAIRATEGLVDGYWLNVPGRGPRCPTCDAPQPDNGRQVLRAVL